MTMAATFAACSAYGRGGREHTSPDYSSTVAVQWDSGPLDLAYKTERTNMDTRHAQETASPRADESSDQRGSRQASESKDLENRYASGKASHSQTLPESGH